MKLAKRVLVSAVAGCGIVGVGFLLLAIGGGWGGRGDFPTPAAAVGAYVVAVPGVLVAEVLPAGGGLHMSFTAIVAVSASCYGLATFALLSLLAQPRAPGGCGLATSTGPDAARGEGA